MTHIKTLSLVALALFGVTKSASASIPEDKKLTFGGDLALQLPVGNLANITSLGIGVLGRIGYAVQPNLEITGRIGYVYGLPKDQAALSGLTINGTGGYNTSVSYVPVLGGARYYFGGKREGLHGDAELGLNFVSTTSSFGGISVSSSTTNVGSNLGVGYLLDGNLPIDLKAQVSILDIGHASDSMMLGVSGGILFF